MPVRVFVSYAHDNEDHKAHVLRFCTLLREHGIDARVDRYDTDTRRDWYAWMTEQINAADYVFAIASPRFKGAADGNAPATRNPGVQSEAALLRDLIHSDRPTWTERLLPIVLPGNTIAEIPQFLQPYCADHYVIPELSLAGIEHLLRTITRQPSHPMPDLGPEPLLPPESKEDEDLDAEGIARRFSRLDPEEAAAELTGLTPKGAAQVLDELNELGADLAAELLDATAPAFAAQALYELADLRGSYLPSRLLTLMRPEPAALLLVSIREGRTPVDPEVATSLLVNDAVPIPDGMDPDKAAALVLGVFAEHPGGLPRVLRHTEPARLVTVLARMTREQAADVLTGGASWRDEEVNAAVLLAMPPDLRAEVLGLMGPDAAAEALTELDTTDAAKILRALPESRAKRLLRRVMTPELAERLREQ